MAPIDLRIYNALRRLRGANEALRSLNKSLEEGLDRIKEGRKAMESKQKKKPHLTLVR